MTISTRSILTAIKCPNLDLVRVTGHGYWYFVFDGAAVYETESVYCVRLNDMDITRWIETGRALVAKCEAMQAEWEQEQARKAKADADRAAGQPPKHLNGHLVIAFNRHANCHTVMVDREQSDSIRYVVATWWKGLGTGWSWGHYCDTMDEANAAMAAVSGRNRNR